LWREVERVCGDGPDRGRALQTYTGEQLPPRRGRRVYRDMFPVGFTSYVLGKSVTAVHRAGDPWGVGECLLVATSEGRFGGMGEPPLPERFVGMSGQLGID
jgi:hypothetical protein